ncbi:MAG: hypothetical protein ACLT0W_12015 [Clostridium sp.]
MEKWHHIPKGRELKETPKGVTVKK